MDKFESSSIDNFFKLLLNQAKDKEEQIYISRHKERYKTILDSISFINFNSVVDIGCGRGHFAMFLKLKYPDKKYTGIDVSVKSVDICKERGVEAYLIDCEKEKTPFSDETFDMAVCLEVIEHVIDNKHLLFEIYRILKKDGIFVLTTPNGQIPYWKIREFLFKYNTIRKLITGDKRKTFDCCHKKLYTESELIEMLENFGFSVISTKLIRIVLPFDDILVITKKICNPEGTKKIHTKENFEKPD